MVRFDYDRYFLQVDIFRGFNKEEEWVFKQDTICRTFCSEQIPHRIKYIPENIAFLESPCWLTQSGWGLINDTLVGYAVDDSKPLRH